MRMRAVVMGFCLAATVPALSCSTALAIVKPAVTIDGPNENIVGFGGVAMAEDGSGGLVYLERVDGVAHVFVSRYLNGQWLTPIQADVGQPYAASWPRIAAANDGELVVVWATPFATEKGKTIDELMGATLGPGASSFGSPMIVDPDIRQGIGTSPDLAIDSSGQGDVVYRVVEEQSGQTSSIPLLRPGDVVEQVRVAHFNGELWSDLGPINRDLGVSMRPPSQLNAPQIAVAPTDDGVVVWQEPEIDGVARIWARRIFGRTLDYVMPASATELNGAPLTGDDDAPSLALSRLGQAEVAYRQAAGPGSPLPGPRVFLNTLPDGVSQRQSGGSFQGAVLADSVVSGGPDATVGPPSVDVDERRQLRLLYDSNGIPRVIEGDDRGLVGALTLGPDFAGASTSAVSVMNPNGGGISAWPSADAAGLPAVAVRENFPDGAVQTALLSGGAGGEIGEIAVGRSDLGDGLIAFQQGPVGNASIVATEATAPPAGLILSVPEQWLKPSQAQVSWEPATSANGPIRYTVVLDGRELQARAGALAMRLPTQGLGSGVHEVRLLATDIDGQQTLSQPASLRIDATPPMVRITTTRHGRAVVVSVRDRYSGLDLASVRVSFGDGRRASGRRRFTHVYAHPGVYVVSVWARDRVGNGAVLRRLVSVK
jgi:PKD domain